jgi:hypothetical protein
MDFCAATAATNVPESFYWSENPIVRPLHREKERFEVNRRATAASSQVWVVLESTDIGDGPRDGHSGTTYFTKKMKYPLSQHEYFDSSVR